VTGLFGSCIESWSRLTGTGLIADDLYLLAHDDVTSRPFLHARALGLGPVGGLLTKLAMQDTIRVQAEQIVLTGPIPHADELARSVHDTLVREDDRHAVQDWLMFLAATAEEDVARRLGHSGYLTQVASRWPWRPTRWAPANPNEAFAALTRVRAALDLANAKPTFPRKRLVHIFTSRFRLRRARHAHHHKPPNRGGLPRPDSGEREYPRRLPLDDQHRRRGGHGARTATGGGGQHRGARRTASGNPPAAIRSR
jgi:hypothetical protein